MTLESLTSKYIRSTDKVLDELQISKCPVTTKVKLINEILEYVTSYLADAKYYKAQNKFEVSLVSVVYCEGLLDALKLIGAVKFEWSTNQEKRR